MQIERVEVPSGTRTILDTLTLEGENEFVQDGRSIPDTPDLFGGAAAVNFTGAEPVMFTSDGSLIDAAGDVTNGTIFVANPDQSGDRARGHDCGRHRHGAHMEMERFAMDAAKPRAAGRPP